MTNANSTFLFALGTPEINDKMNNHLLHDVSLTTALKWLANIRDVAERENRNQIAMNPNGNAFEESKNMPIIENYKQYGIPDMPVNPDTGKARIINLFIVGCGARADGYLQALLLDFKTGTSPYRIVGIADPIQSARERLLNLIRKSGQEDPIAEYGDWRDVKDMDGTQIDIALIMTLDRDHAEPAVKFMSKGCHVIVEKPLGVNPSEMNDMIYAMHKYKRIAAVCTVLEYTSHARKMKDLISNLGEVEELLIREQVGWHHDAYAFSTGPFSKTSTTSPYTIAKTIHDMSMGLALTGCSIEEMTYIPSKSKANRGKYFGKKNIDPDLLEPYEPYSYLARYIIKLIREMKIVDPTIDEISRRLCEKDASGKYVLPIPDYDHVDAHSLTDSQIYQIAELYKPFHLFLDRTNYWFNPMLYRGEDCDQPAGFTIVSSMSNGCQFNMICSPLSSAVCVRHYQIRCIDGELVSDVPEITCTKFGTRANNMPFPKNECSVPDESRISKRTMHEGADAMFIHTVARQMTDAIVRIKELEKDGDDDALIKYTSEHPLNVHFERNARLTIAILEATQKPGECVKISQF